ncbi:MAG: response regulator [Myxococcales bacterium]|nr:response regulator [Myxococcales bacterium]
MSRRNLGAGLRVLLLDDSPDAVDFERTLLERYGFEVVTCLSLDDLADCPEGWTPHVVVSDVDLPDAVDTDVVVALSEHPTTKGAPVVLCSGLPIVELERIRDERGVAGCVSKSDNIRDLPQALADLVRPSA